MTVDEGRGVPLPWWVAVALVAGWWPAAALCGAAAVGVGWAVVRVVTAAGPTSRTRLLAGTVAVVIAVGAGALVRDTLRTNGPLLDLAARGGAAEVDLLVVTEPRLTDEGWWALVRVHRVGADGTRQRALLRGVDDPPALWNRWTGRATARPLRPERPFESYVATLHGAAVVAPVEAGSWAPPGWLGTSTEWLRSRVRAAARGPSDDPRGLVVGLVTGDTRGLSPEAQDQLREAGLSHLTAVSGSNVALVVAACLGLLTLLPIGPVGRAVGVAVAVLLFAVLTRFEPSVLRASTMAILVALAWVRRTVADGRHALGGAVLLLLLIDPLLARSLGLLLSAAAAAGILLLAPVLRARLSSGRARLPGWLATAVSVTMAAQIGVAPVLLAVEGSVGLADVPANLLAVPLAAVASVLGGVGALLAVVHPWLGVPLVAVASVPAAGILGVADLLADRGTVLSTAAPLGLLGAAAVVVAVVADRGPRTRRWSVVVACLTVAATLAPVGSGAVRTLTVTAIDVGQGDAILVRAPGDVEVLVDAGPDDRAADWLRRHGIGRLDLAVVSHPHLDHVGGMAEVLDRVGAERLWHRPVPNELPEAAAVVPTALAVGALVEEPHAGQSLLLGEVLVEVVGPSRGRPFAFSERELNDTSLVLRISWRGRSVLLTGDAEVAAQASLLTRPDRLRADVLKVPHHGGSTSLPAFLAAVGARDAIISAGRGNRYGHPRPEVVDQLVASGARIHRTDRTGTVTIEVRSRA